MFRARPALELGARVGDARRSDRPSAECRRPAGADGSGPRASSARSSCPTCSPADTACAPSGVATLRTAAGSVESSMCRRGQPGATPMTARSTSGARLDPPMPSRTTSVKPLRLMLPQTSAAVRWSRPSAEATSSSRAVRRSLSAPRRRDSTRRGRLATIRAPRRPRAAVAPETDSARPGDGCSEFARRARLAATSSAGQRVVNS